MAICDDTAGINYQCIMVFVLTRLRTIVCAETDGIVISTVMHSNEVGSVA